MEDLSKSKQSSTGEMASLRRRVRELEQSESERKRAEEALLASEENFRRSLDESPMGIRIVSAEGETTYANQAILDIYGYDSIDELRATLVMNRYTPESFAEFQKRRDKRKRGEYLPSEYEISIIRKDSEVRHLHVFRKEILWDGKRQYQVIYQDTTERKQAEAALRDRDIKFKKLSAWVPGMIYQFTKRPDGTYCLPFATEAIRNLYGCSPQDVREDFSPIVRAIFPDDLDKFLGSIEYATKHVTNWTCEYRVQIPGQPIQWTLGNSAPEKLADGSITWYGFNADITNRKRAEEKLCQSEEKYRSIFENAQEGIYRTTPEGRFVMANQAMARTLGYDSPNELMDSMTNITHQLYVDPKDRTKVMELIERQGFAKDEGLQFYRKDRRTIWVYLTVRPIRNEQGQLLYYEGIVQDITDRKESVARLREALGGTVRAIASLVEMRDPYTAGHQNHVSDLAHAIATEVGLSKDQIEGLRIAGKIHDIGKVSIPAEILSMPRKLTAIEFNLIKTHAQSGHDIIKDIEFPWPIARMILEHHERLDGSGYPHGLTGDNLLLESRILSVADVVEAMATNRPYRPALGLDAALGEITKNKGVLYDTDAVDACMRLFREKGYKINYA